MPHDTQSLQVIALEPRIHCGVVMLDFHRKQALFAYRGHAFYRMSGFMDFNADPDSAVYGTVNRLGEINGQATWALSRNMRTLIQWVDRRESRRLRSLKVREGS